MSHKTGEMLLAAVLIVTNNDPNSLKELDWLVLGKVCQKLSKMMKFD